MRKAFDDLTAKIKDELEDLPPLAETLDAEARARRTDDAATDE